MQGVDPDKFTAFNVLEDQELRAGTWIKQSNIESLPLEEVV